MLRWRAADRRRAGASWAVCMAASAHRLLKFRCLLELQLRCAAPTRTAGKAAAHTYRCLHPLTFSWKCSSVSRAGGGSLLRVVMVYRTPSCTRRQGESGHACSERACPARQAQVAREQPRRPLTACTGTAWRAGHGPEMHARHAWHARQLMHKRTCRLSMRSYERWPLKMVSPSRTCSSRTEGEAQLANLQCRLNSTAANAAPLRESSRPPGRPHASPAAPGACAPAAAAAPPSPPLAAPRRLERCTLDEQTASLHWNAPPECNAKPKRSMHLCRWIFSRPTSRGSANLAQLAKLLSLPAHLDRPKDEVHVTCAQHLLVH